MSNQIYLRIGKPKRFRPEKKDKPMNPIRYFIIKWSIILGFCYFFLGDIVRFLFNLK